MGSPQILWYPNGKPTLSTITLPFVSRLNPQPTRDVVDAVAARSFRHDRGGAREFTIKTTLTERDHSSVLRQLRSLDTHLRSGGRIGFCFDAALLWGSWARTSVESGDTYLDTEGNAFAAWAASASLPAGTRITAESPNPDHLREHHTVTSTTGGSGGTLRVNLANAQEQTLSDPVFVRYEHFYPSCVLPEDVARDGAWLEDDERAPGRVYQVNLPLRESPGEILALRSSAENLVGQIVANTNLGLDFGLVTLDQAVAAPPVEFTGLGRVGAVTNWSKGFRRRS